MIERLMIMVPGDTITAQDLGFLGHDGLCDGPMPPSEDVVVPLSEARERFERDYILQALAAQQGNISRTADVLGVERSTCTRRCGRSGLRRRASELMDCWWIAPK